MADLRPSLSATQNGTYQWLLVLNIGSRTIQVNTGDPVTITGKDGEVYEFKGGLGPANYERTLDLWASTPSPRSQSFQVFLDFDIALQIARGTPLFAASGELSQWYEGTPWEERRVVLRGTLEEPSYGPLNEPFAFSLTENPIEDRAVIPEPSWTVQEGVTFTEGATVGPDPGIIGAQYPLVIGAPGQAPGVGTTSTFRSNDVPATPVLLVRRDTSSSTLTNFRLLIAGGEVTTTDIKIVNLTNESKTFSTSIIATDTDGLGQSYSYVNPTLGKDPAEGDQLYAIWDPDDGGGVRNWWGTGTLRGAGDVIRWALQQSTLRVDHSRLGELTILNSFKVDAFINAPISPWSWVSSNLLPLLPVSVATGPDGLYVTPWLVAGLSNEDAVEVIEEGRNAIRQGNVVYTSSDSVFNEITIRFAPNASTGSPALRRVITSQGNHDASDPNSSPNLWCTRSQGIFGTKRLDIETKVVYDTATAESILQYMARRHSHPRREVIYSVPRKMDWLRPGDVVKVTDADLHLSEVIGYLGSIAYGDDSLTVQVIIFEPLVFSR